MAGRAARAEIELRRTEVAPIVRKETERRAALAAPETSSASA
jgi:hypothetical protein